MQVKEKQGQHQLSDREVVERVLTGEKELYEILMRRYNQKLYRVIRGYLKDACEVEDAMQNTYLKAYEKLYQFHGEAQFSTWLVRIGINEALGWLRQNQKAAFLHSIQEDQPDQQLLELPDTKSMNPEINTIHKEMQLLLEQAIDNLPTKYRVVYMLREVEEMSTAEVTACLAISESNLKVRLHRAKTLLKENLYQLSASRDVFTFGSKHCDKLVNQVMARLQQV
ncbi:RNA polymerase sigma factor [Pontibacter liquoris]|uniref:RNA polymerase sigma factor n=1 Tax=Pontibacter liquoris TaxID=2905677 RepID=UPI001FA71EF2|nr:RNA polymerase sigma factor [Pontibacter liquoris]